MSLFGGPLPPQTPSQPRHESPYYRSSPPLPSSPPPVRDDDEPAESIERDPDTDDEASYEHTDDESENGRPRFRGQWWTYRNHIAEERHLIESLEQLRAEDLSLHLYNAHALKRRVRSENAAASAKPWHSKAKWVDKDMADAWVPPRSWTAWPLDPSRVPRPHERFTKRPMLDPEDKHTIPGNETETAFETDAPQARGRKRRKNNQSGSAGEPSAKRSRGRPPKALFQAAASTPDVTSASASPSASPRKRRQGRPRQYLKPLPGESYYMMRKRHRQLQAAGQLPGAGNDFSTSRAQTTEPEPDSSRAPSPVAAAAAPGPVSDDSVASEDDGVEVEKGPPTRRGKHAVGLRDWSEVLGMAAMLGGFKPDVIDRAARRCANLFGEGMAFQVLEESTALETHGERVEYVPEAVPPPEGLESESEDEDGDEEEVDENERPNDGNGYGQREN
ncbi:RNA polymerase I specific transcription initiation factor RRN9 [Neofusicoccum parvum]|nr:RNA polymerase I specific transcription initiation factor RRN9 [Neofusicoccum parvum]